VTAVNLTKRGKLLTGIAALIAAYVLFGPKDSDSVEPTRASARPAASHEAHPAGSVSAPVARSLLALAHRVVEQSAAGALFATHSWYVPPPAPPPPPPVAAAPVEPPAPVAPPLPFTYMGSYAPDGAKPVFFLTQGDRVYDVHLGDTLEGGTYTVDAFTNGALIFTYKPLNQQQQLSTGGAP
jgi:hypothetical protein